MKEIEAYVRGAPTNEFFVFTGFILTTRNSVENPFGIRFENLSKIEIVYNFNTI